MLAVEVAEAQPAQFGDADAGVVEHPEDGAVARGSAVGNGPASLGGVQASSSRSNSSASMVWMSGLPTLGNTTRSKGLLSIVSRRTNQWKKARAERA